MKICILTTNLKHGGATIIAEDVARGMAQKGHEVLFVCSGEKSESYSHNGYSVQVLSNKWQNPFYHYINPLLLIKLVFLLNRFKPDILHIHNINLQTFSLSVLFFSLKFPVVWTLHDLWPLCMVGWPNPPDCIHIKEGCRNCSTWPSAIARFNKFIKEIVFRLSKMSIVCPSDWMVHMLQYSILKDHSVHTVYNGIEKNSFHSLAEKGQNLKPEVLNKKKIILFCGGKKLAGQLPAERKGWHYLISAFRLLKSESKEIELLYLGDPVTLSDDFPVSVRFVKGIDRDGMYKYYNIADLFILPTLADNFPLTILEAMACKTPIISTDVGGISEIIISGETGLLCPPQDLIALAEKISYALSNPDRCSEMAEKAYQRLKEIFTFDRMINQYEKIYIKTIADREK